MLSYLAFNRNLFHRVSNYLILPKGLIAALSWASLSNKPSINHTTEGNSQVSISCFSLPPSQLQSSCLYTSLSTISKSNEFKKVEFLNSFDSLLSFALISAMLASSQSSLLLPVHFVLHMSLFIFLFVAKSCSLSSHGICCNAMLLKFSFPFTCITATSF